MNTSIDHYYVRNPEIAHAATSSGYLCVRPERDPLAIGPVNGARIGRFLDRLWRPRSRAEVLAVVDEPTLRLFVAQGVVLEASEDELNERLGWSRAAIARDCHVVIGVSGSIASGFVLPQIQLLAERFAKRIDVIMTRAAHHFLNPRILEHMGIEVFVDDFAKRGAIAVPHIHLARAADLILIMPASARTIARLAHGSCSDLLSLTVAATRAPVVAMPSMNIAMYENHAVQRNLTQLQEDGVFVVGPAVSRALADGSAGKPSFGALGAGDGRLVELLECILAQHTGSPGAA